MIQRYLFSALLLSIATLSSCGKNTETRVGTTIVDFTQNDVIQFKAGSSFGVSASRFDLQLSTKSLKKYGYSATEGQYKVEKEMTMTEAAKSSLNEKLKKIAVKNQAFSACKAAVCSAGRASVWMELTSPSPARYFFSNQGDCSCESDGENAPTLSYSQMDVIYKELLALLGT